MSHAERQHRNRQRWLLFAAIAIGIALLLLTLAQAGHTPSAASLMLLPILFIGLLPTPCRLVRIDYMRLGFAPGEPVRASSFQRPPPCPRA
jgi:hypothetical protein